MGSENVNNLRPRKNSIESIKPKNWNDYRESIFSQALGRSIEERGEIYKSNFLHAIELTFGKNSKVYNELKNVNPAKLYESSFSNPVLVIDFVRSPCGIQILYLYGKAQSPALHTQLSLYAVSSVSGIATPFSGWYPLALFIYR